MLIGAGVVVALILVVLAIPLRLRFVADSTSSPRFRVEGTWFFGLARFRSGPNRMKRSKREAPRRRTKRGTARRAWRFIRTPGVWARCEALIRRLGRSLRLRVDGLRVVIGLGDPADTGRAWGLFGPLSGWFAQRYGGRLEPDFHQEVFAIDGSAQVQVVPLRIIGTVLRFVFSPVILRAYHGSRA